LKLRTLACLIGAIAISSAPFVLAVTGGGFPSLPQFSGVGVNTPAQTVTGVTVQQLSPNVTAIQAKNDTAHDVEILASTSTAGNAQFRATNFGGTNWAWGNTRSSGNFDICPAATLTGCIFDVNTAGSQPVFASASSITLKSKTSTAANNAQLEIQGASTSLGGMCTSDTAAACGVGQAANDVDFFGTGTLHFGPTTGQVSADYITASSTTISFPNATTISAPNASTVPWGKAPCIIKITFSGTTPSIGSSSGCSSPGIVRNSVGSYTFSDANITGLIGVCTPNSSSSGPYLQDLVSIGSGSALVNNFAVPGTASVLADIPSGASLTCRFDR